MKKTMTLKLDQIIFDMSINPREEIDDATAYKYGHIIEEMPNIEVFDVDGRLVLASGFHRYVGMKKREMTEAEVDVHTGTIEDAQCYADQSNAKNPLPLTNDELVGVCKRALKRNPKLTNRQLMRQYGVPVKMAEDVRKWLGYHNGDLFGNTSEDYDDEMPYVAYNPYKAELSWEQLWAKAARRMTTLDERLTPCEICEWPLSVRAHIIDNKTWGGNEYTRQLCTRCHELVDIMIKTIETEKGRAPRIMAWIHEKRGESDPQIKGCWEIAKSAVTLRTELFKNMQQTLLHKAKHKQEISNFLRRNGSDR